MRRLVILLLAALLTVNALCENTDLIIDKGALGDEPTFIDWTQDGTAMQLIAIRDADGAVRLALNTCQSCHGSPWAWFELLDDGQLQCQNCGLTFAPDAVGTLDAVGCNPITITGFAQDGETVTVPEALLAEASALFANWKKIDG